MQTPSDVYRPSQRRLMRALVGGFPAHTEIVKLGANGKFWLDGRHHVFVSSSLGGLQIGLERVDGGLIHVWYHHLLIGHLCVGPMVGRHVTVQPLTPSAASDRGRLREVLVAVGDRQQAHQRGRESSAPSDFALLNAPGAVSTEMFLVPPVPLFVTLRPGADPDLLLAPTRRARGFEARRSDRVSRRPL